MDGATTQRLKRACDIFVAAALLVLASPLLATISVFVKMCSPGPALFAQQRIGLHGQPFCLWKFRTMRIATELEKSRTVSTRDDPRVFPGGRLLRMLKLDELPQLWNVANGTMSLVGPRPTVADDYCRMASRQRSRCSVRPGLTGLAQIRGNTSLQWPERIEWDLRYIEHQSLWLDARILAETCWQLLTIRADTHPSGEDEWTAVA